MGVVVVGWLLGWPVIRLAGWCLGFGLARGR